MSLLRSAIHDSMFLWYAFIYQFLQRFSSFLMFTLIRVLLVNQGDQVYTVFVFDSLEEVVHFRDDVVLVI